MFDVRNQAFDGLDAAEMSAKIHTMPGVGISAGQATEPNADLIEMLGDLLARAQSGELQAFAYAGVSRASSECGASFTVVVDAMILVGRLEMVKADIVTDTSAALGEAT
jgi:hypothetical protein